MKPEKMIIEIENGIIKSIDTNTNISKIITEKGEQTFETGYILPGLVDSHCHVWGLGMIIHDPNLIGTKSKEECLEIIKKHTPNRGNWFFGRGWNEQLWDNKDYPTKEDLDKHFPDKPVFMYRIDGHAAWVNSKALELAGINKDSPNPEGGEIMKDSSGEPTGILVDNAATALFEIMPYYDHEYLEKMIIDALKDCASKGLTEVHDVDVDPRQVPIFKKLAKEGKLATRVISYVSAQNDEYLKHNITPYESEMFTIKGVKMFADGALGSRGAALLEPYSDKSDTKGLFLMEEEEMFKKAKKAVEQDFSVAIHAIGDAAVRMVLNVYERIRKEVNPPENIHLRIEHSQTVTKEDLKRYKELKVIPTVQAIHCTSDAATITEDRLGKDRLDTAYPWKSFLEQGTKILGGSDFPIESNDPILGIKAFIKRIPNGHKKSWQDQEIINQEQAIAAYTHDVHTEIGIYDRGTIEVGKQADLTVLDKFDFYNEINVLGTYCNGETTYLK